MPLLNYTTAVSPDKTILEIQKLLVKHGARKFMIEYDEELPTGLSFEVLVNDRSLIFSLPAKWEPVLKKLQADQVATKYCTKEQAIKVSWRIIKDWIASHMALLDAQMVELSEIMLPFVITPSGKTLYHHVLNNQALLEE